MRSFSFMKLELYQKMENKRFKELEVYKKSFELLMKIFVISKKFPKEEKYALTDQIRRSSRSVCANLAESYRKRRYPNHFIAKLTDCDMENSETDVWLDFALACNYINSEMHKELQSYNTEIGKLLNYMISHHRKFL